MHTYALSIPYKFFEDAAFIDAALKSKVRKFEVGGANAAKPEDYAVAVQNMMASCLEAASVHIPFGATPWVPSRAAERDITLEAVRGLMNAWAPLHPPRFTMHGCTEADREIPRDQQIADVRGFIEALLPDIERLGTSVNIEYLPRTCIGNCPEELEAIVDGFPPELVGICLDVNHASPRTEIMPSLIKRLGPRINTFHISDTDGEDECHWYPGYGIVDWPACMKEIKALERDVLMILEVFRVPFPEWQLGYHHNNHSSDLAAMEHNVFFLENAEELTARLREFSFPG